jgi:hypothetical protein
MLKWFRSPIRGIALGLLLLMGVSANTTVAPQIGSGPSIRFRIQIPNGVQRGQILGVTRQLVARGFDVAGLNLDTGAIDVISNQPGIDTLAKLGFKGVVISTSDTFSPDRRYLNPETLNSKMAALAGYSGGIAKVVNIGKTNQGRPLQALLLSTTLDVNSPAYFSKPTIIFDGLHHAREVMTPEIVLDVAEMLIKNQNRKFFNDILKSWNVWIVPMVNPDGSNIVWTSNSMWRKNARAGMASIYGVDVNRNFRFSD